MSNPQHLAKLKEGVGPWAQWRNKNPEINPDLSYADLHWSNLNDAYLKRANLVHADLSEAELIGADLSEADLSEADLHGTYLQRALLRGSDLVRANLRKANLSGADLTVADLSGSDLREVVLIAANLQGANLVEADLRWAYLYRTDFVQGDLTRADLRLARLFEANLSGGNFCGANLRGADLRATDLTGTDFSGADLSEADLRYGTLVKTNFGGANLTSCCVFGTSVWNVNLVGAIQSNLRITLEDDSPIHVDNLDVAQFIYLLLNNQKIRNVIDTITSKVVLILGRFTPDRKVVLDAIRGELRKHDYLPVLFDFEKPSSRTTVETISTLAQMSRFVIADLTDAKSVLQELQAVIPFSPSVPVQLLLLASQEEPGMLDFIHTFRSVLSTHRYTAPADLLAALKEAVIDPAEAKAKEFAPEKRA